MAAVQHRDWAFLSHSDAEKHAAALDVLCRNAKHSSQALDLASKCSDLFDTISSTREADGNIAYIDAAEVSMDDFHRRFAASLRPCMIRNLAERPDGPGNSPNPWPALSRWMSPQAFAQHHGDVPFRLTELAPLFGLGKPMPIRVPLGMYMEYCQANAADYPWYAFGDDFEGERRALLEDYSVPAMFRDDLYDVTPETRASFPRFRYMVIGGPRSGSNMHVDPRFTSAWNTLLCGHKRWVLFPPGDDPEYLASIGVPCDVGGEGMGKTAAPPAQWWLDTYPRLRAGEGARLGMVECLQRPGETIFVPVGWWHAVLNLDGTIAVTQNALLPATLPAVWASLRSRYPRVAAHIRRAVEGRGEGWEGVTWEEVWEVVGSEEGAGDEGGEGGEGDDEDIVVVASRVEADDADGAVGTPVVLAGGHVVYV